MKIRWIIQDELIFIRRDGRGNIITRYKAP